MKKYNVKSIMSRAWAIYHETDKGDGLRPVFSLCLSPLWGWCFVRSGAVWACPGVPVSSAAALVGLALGDDAGQKDMA